MSYRIFTDTSANLPHDLIEENALGIIPFHYFIDGNSYECADLRTFDGDSFYDKIRNGMRVTTSLISPQEYREAFEPVLQQGEDILFVSMSSGISGSFNAARLAALDLEEDYPDRNLELVDTLGASLGEGLLALYASRLRAAGTSLRDAALQLRVKAEKMFQIFTVDDLLHLSRGGRLSNLSAVVGTVLGLKPLLKGDPEGKIVAFSKIRGRKRTLEAIAAKYDELVVRPMEQVIGIAQAGCREDAAKLAQLLRRNNPPKEILTVEYEPVTGSYVGPGALALFFEGADGVRLAT